MRNGGKAKGNSLQADRSRIKSEHIGFTSEQINNRLVLLKRRNMSDKVI